MTSNKIKLIKLVPDEYPITVEISSTDYSLRKAVNSCNYRKAQIRAIDEDACVIFNKNLSFSGLQPIPLNNDVCILCNEEAKIIGLEPNPRLWSDVLCGVFYVTGQDGEGNLCSLSAKEMEYYKALFAVPKSISHKEVDEMLMTGFYFREEF